MSYLLYALPPLCPPFFTPSYNPALPLLLPSSLPPPLGSVISTAHKMVEEEKEQNPDTWRRKRWRCLSADIPVDVLSVPAEEKGPRGGLEEREEMQDLLVVKEDMIVYFPLALFPLVFYPCSSCSGVLPTKKKLNRHIVKMHKVPSKNLFARPASCTYHYPSPSRPVKKAFGGRDTSRGTRLSATRPPALILDPVQPLWKESSS